MQIKHCNKLKAHPGWLWAWARARARSRLDVMDAMDVMDEMDGKNKPQRSQRTQRGGLLELSYLTIISKDKAQRI